MAAIRDSCAAAAIFWDDEFDAPCPSSSSCPRVRHPEVRENWPQVRSASVEYIESLIEHEYEAIGAPAKHLPRGSPRSRAAVQRARISRLVDPEAIDDEVLWVTLEVLYGGMGIDPVDDQ